MGEPAEVLPDALVNSEAAEAKPDLQLIEGLGEKALSAMDYTMMLLADGNNTIISYRREDVEANGGRPKVFRPTYPVRQIHPVQ